MKYIPNMRVRVIGLVFAVLAALVLSGRTRVTGQTPDAQPPVLHYAADGKLAFPSAYREWVFVSSGLGMSYTPTTANDPVFTNVFVNADAYRAFVDTGRWPDRTALALELYSAETNGSINRGGHYQREFRGVELHVKDASRGGDAWKFYTFGRSRDPQAPLPDGNACSTCHREHGAVDNTFVQFYPTLLEIARVKGTVR